MVAPLVIVGCDSTLHFVPQYIISPVSLFSEVKNLGVVMGSALTLKSHIVVIVAKANLRVIHTSFLLFITFSDTACSSTRPNKIVSLYSL